MGLLVRVNLVLFVVLIAHTVDHAVNQPARDLPVTGSFLGVAGFAIVAVSSLVALRHSPLAPTAAIGLGMATAVGVIAVHLLPVWSEAISDPYWDFAADGISWAILLAPLLASLWLAALGARELRARPALSS